MEILKTNFDARSECLSILTCMTLEKYKSIVYKPFSRGGNLDGQREVIKRSSVASKIRKRMHEDFIAGAIFPQVVIGVLLPSEQFQEIKDARESFAPDQYGEDAFSIIDGMQRSNIYFSNYDGNEQREIRVEFWISDKTIKLLYRMLVLNTGQVPWNTRRQIEVIFSGLSRSIIERALEKNPELEGKIEIIGVDDAKRRTQAGKYHKSTMIELYLGFNTRKVKVDVSDELADEFQRFDMMESIEKDSSFDLFVSAFVFLCKLDMAFSNCNSSAKIGQFKEGKDIFSSVPACLGFVVACAEYIMGKIPVEREEVVKNEKLARLDSQIQRIVEIANKNSEGDFLALESLNAVVEQLPKTRIGDEMRSYFKQAFTELLKYDEIDEILSMEAFWRS